MNALIRKFGNLFKRSNNNNNDDDDNESNDGQDSSDSTFVPESLSFCSEEFCSDDCSSSGATGSDERYLETLRKSAIERGIFTSQQYARIFDARYATVGAQEAVGFQDAVDFPRATAIATTAATPTSAATSFTQAVATSATAASVEVASVEAASVEAVAVATSSTEQTDEEGQNVETLLCVVCEERSRTILFMPCRHCTACESCSKQLQKCPICRRGLEQKIKVIYS